jgi:hypothetical protein
MLLIHHFDYGISAQFYIKNIMRVCIEIAGWGHDSTGRVIAKQA